MFKCANLGTFGSLTIGELGKCVLKAISTHFGDLGVVQMAKCSDLGARELGTFKVLCFHSPLNTFWDV